jgi:hypothetical protein
MCNVVNLMFVQMGKRVIGVCVPPSVSGLKRLTHGGLAIHRQTLSLHER